MCLPGFDDIEDALLRLIGNVRLAEIGVTCDCRRGVVGVSHHAAGRLRQGPHAAGRARTRVHLAQRPAVVENNRVRKYLFDCPPRSENNENVMFTVDQTILS